MSRLARLLGILMVLIAVATLPLGILVALFVGLFEAAVVFVVGWLLLVPITAILAGALGVEPAQVTPGGGSSTDEASETHEADVPDENPIDVLRDRYARGEIDEAELERRLDALLELEELAPGDEATVERIRDRLETGDTPVEFERE